MDRNTVTGLLLIGMILIGYSLWMQPNEAQIEAAKRQQDSIANVTAENEAKLIQQELEIKAQRDTIPVVADSADSAQMVAIEQSRLNQEVQRYGEFAYAAQGEAGYHTIENEFVKLTLSSRGAVPVQGELKNYVTWDSLPLYLFDKETSEFNFGFWISKNTEIQASDLLFEPIADAMSDTTAVYRLYAVDRQRYLEVRYSIASGESYVVDATVHFEGLESALSASDNLVELSWRIQAPTHEKGIDQEKNKTTVFYRLLDSDVDYIAERDFEKQDLAATVQWIAFKQQFFSAALISETGFNKTGAEIETFEPQDSRYIKGLAASVSIDMPEGNSSDGSFSLYLGPNHYQTLDDLEIGLEDQIDLGWGIFGWVNRWLVIPTFNILDEYTGLSYGIIILLLTILIKIILFPLTWKNYLSSARMRVLKPEVDEINEKMKDKDPMAKQQAVMAMYRQAGVNPMAGCIPMLLQLPILYAMFQFFPASIELRQEAFLWATDLSTYDSIISWSTQIPLLSTWYGNHISLFTILMAVSTFFYSKYNMDLAGSGATAQMPQMKVMIYLMPFMLLFIFNTYSSGLSYYYFSANVISMLQQWAIKKYFINEDEIHRKIQENKKKPAKKSSFQERLEKMTRERTQAVKTKKK